MSELLVAPHTRISRNSQQLSRRAAVADRWRVTYSPTVIGVFLAVCGLAFIVPLGSKGALLFLLAGFGLVATDVGRALHDLRREWLLVLIAVWCVMSFAWSAYPAQSMRYGIQLLLTLIVGIVIGYRIRPESFLKIIFTTSVMAAVASILVGRARADGGGYLGIYASKNAFADAASLLILASMAILMDRRVGLRWRIPAGVMVPLGAVLLVMGKSSGALVSTAAVVMFYGVIVLLNRMTPTARLVSVVMTAVLLAFAGVVLFSFRDELAMAFLNLTGKDVTLTGRTDLWAVALAQIAERPLLGTGFQAFWVQGQPLAEQLWAQFGIAARAGFHFHNTILSNAVEIGLPATILQVLVFAGGVWGCLKISIRRPTAASIFFALYMTRLFLLMWIEVSYFNQFSISTLIIVVCICMSHRQREPLSQAPRQASYR